MLKVSAEKSQFVKLLKEIWARYHTLKLLFYETNKNSYTNKIVQNLSYTVKIFARYSFLAKITEINIEPNIAIFDGSKVIRWSVNLFNKCKYRIIAYLKTSIISGAIGELNKEFIRLTVRNTSIIMIVATLTNIFFSILFKKEIGLFGWFMRGLLLFTGFNGLYTDTTWAEVSKTSYFLKGFKRLNNPCKI